MKRSRGASKQEVADVANTADDVNEADPDVEAVVHVLRVLAEEFVQDGCPLQARGNSLHGPAGCVKSAVARALYSFLITWKQVLLLNVVLPKGRGVFCARVCTCEPYHSDVRFHFQAIKCLEAVASSVASPLPLTEVQAGVS